MDINMFELERLVRAALIEDVGTGDITTMTTIDRGRRALGRYLAKESGVLCGLDIVLYVYHMLDPAVEMRFHFRDGDRISRGDVIAEVRGEAVSLLTGERIGLNLLQHLSGIATKTHEAVAAVEGYRAKITDTRKTTPGLRTLEKYAVRCGGGTNHRFNLSDGILIKDNHIVAAGSITNAINAARSKAPHTLKIEVEVETFEQLEEALTARADIIMLDNMSNENMAEAVRRIDGRAISEASGNMGEKNLADVAATGVDLISIGALTHSVRALDISLKFSIEEKKAPRVQDL